MHVISYLADPQDNWYILATFWLLLLRLQRHGYREGLVSSLVMSLVLYFCPLKAFLLRAFRKAGVLLI